MRWILLLAVLLCSGLSYVTPFTTPITITGGTALLTAVTVQVNFSGIDTSGNVYTVGALSEGALPQLAPPGGIIQYAAHVDLNFVTLNGTETFSQIGDGHGNTILGQLDMGGSAQAPSFPSPLDSTGTVATVLGPFSISGLIARCTFDGCTSAPVNLATGLAALRLFGDGNGADMPGCMPMPSTAQL